MPVIEKEPTIGTRNGKSGPNSNGSNSNGNSSSRQINNSDRHLGDNNINRNTKQIIIGLLMKVIPILSWESIMVPPKQQVCKAFQKQMLQQHLDTQPNT
jgi:hypothetical protein